MCNGNIYKGFCAVFMVLVMIFCGGMCVYAHGDKLKKKLAKAYKHPTIENLECVYKLYKRDAKYYKSLRKYLKAKKSKAHASYIKALQADVIAEQNNRVEDFTYASDLWDIAATLEKEAENTQYEIKAKVNAAMANAKLSEIMAKNDSTSSNWENTTKLYDIAVKLEQEYKDEYDKVAIVKKDNNPEYWKNEAQYWDKIAKFNEEEGKIEDTNRS